MACTHPAEMTAFGVFLCILAFALFILWWFEVLIHTLSIINGQWRLHKAIKNPNTTSLPGVSIIKPLSGSDPNLVENLTTFFTSKYHKFELLFCIEKTNDIAIPVIQHLMQTHPNTDAKLFLGGRNTGMNPKINNMMTAYEAAKYSLLLISDASLRMGENTLLSMVETMTHDVGLVHQIPYCVERPGFAARLEKVYFGTHHAMTYLATDFCGINCVNGMSCLFRKRILDEVGGLQAFSQYLAEDFHMSKLVIDKGFKCRVCPIPAQQNSGFISLQGFHDRMIRWSKLRTSLMPWMTILEPTTECIMQAIIVAWATNYLFGWNPVLFIIVHISRWFLMDYLLMRIIQGGPLHFSIWEYTYTWLYREVSAIYWLIKTHGDAMVQWREKHYIIGKNGTAQIILNSSLAPRPSVC